MRSDDATDETGLTVIRRLHRLVRHGYRPLLGYDVASLLDGAIQLRLKRTEATILPDGTVTFDPGVDRIDGADHAGFDALFPPNAPNKRNLTRRLYEMGF